MLLVPSDVLGAQENDGRLFFEGQGWVEKHQPKKAIPLLTEFLEKFPQSKVRDLGYFWLGRAYLETNQTEKSRETLSNIRKEFPESRLVSRLERLILSKESARKKSDGGAPPAGSVPKMSHPSGAGRVEPSVKTPSGEPGGTAEKIVTKPAEGFTLVIPQVADVRALPVSGAVHAYPGEEVEFPIVVTNRGNGEDGFGLESTFSPDYHPAFLSAEEGKDKKEIQGIPPLKPDQSFHAVLRVRLPADLTDGQEKSFQVRVSSKYDRNIFQWIQEAVIARAPLLRGEYHIDKERVRPGEEIRHAVLLQNEGSSEGREVKVRFNYHSSLIFLSAVPQPEKIESTDRSLYWTFPKVGSKEGRKIEVLFKVGDETAAGQQILNRGVYHSSVGTETPFLSPVVTVNQVSSVRVEGLKEEIRTVSGETIYLPFTLANLGNGPDRFALRGEGLPTERLAVYHDQNQDGLYEPGEPLISETPPVGSRENLHLLLAVKVPQGSDGKRLDVGVEVRSLRDPSAISASTRTLVLNLPSVVVQTHLQSADSSPGGVISYQQTVMNTGSGVAKNIVLTELIPPELEYVHADPDPAGEQDKALVWKMTELGPQQKRVFSVSLRIRKGLPAGTTVQKKAEIYYQDANGNEYP